MASFRAQLSPNEETTLLRVATGVSDHGGLRESDTKRLIALGLIEEIDGNLSVTKLGLERCGSDKPPLSKPVERGRRLKTRQLPI